jgi:hypothetical protein
MTTAGQPENNVLRTLLEIVAFEAEAIARALEQIADEAFIETAGGLRPDTGYVLVTGNDGTVSIEFGDRRRGQRRAVDRDPVAVRYERVSGRITLEYRPREAPARPPAASDLSRRGGDAPGRRSRGVRPPPRRR